MKVMKTMGRQGDVLLVNSKHTKLRPATRERLFGKQYSKKVDFKTEKAFVLAYGEGSGHKHAFRQEEGIELLYSNDVAETQKMLKIAEGVEAPLQHEEHEGFKVPEGDNVVLGQHEYRLQKIVRAAD